MNDQNQDAIDRLLKGPKSWMMIIIVLINAAMFLVTELTGSSLDAEHMLEMGAAYSPYIQEGEIYRLFTSMFLHFGISHLINNLILLIFIGDCLERAAGRIKFLIIYLGGGLFGNLLSYRLELNSGDFAVSAGASGAIFAVVGAMLYIVIRHKGQFEDISLQRLLMMAVLTIYYGATASGIDNAAHVGGLLAGFVLAVVLYHKKEV